MNTLDIKIPNGLSTYDAITLLDCELAAAGRSEADIIEMHLGYHGMDDDFVKNQRTLRITFKEPTSNDFAPGCGRGKNSY